MLPSLNTVFAEKPLDAKPKILLAPQPKSLHSAMDGARIPSLDGIRALAILFVLIGHAVLTSSTPKLLSLLAPLGELGVQVFFVLSGFLITTLLTQEFKNKGRISISGFYYRRLIRIFPAAYFYLTVVTLLAARQIGFLRLTSAWMYVTNFYSLPHNSAEFLVGHLWSLAVEEQFYLLWPVVLGLLMTKRRNPNSVLIAVIVLAPFCRIACYLVLGVGSGGNWRGAHLFPCVADAMAMGCLLSLTFEKVAMVPGLQRRAFLLAPVLIVAFSLSRLGPWLVNTIGLTLVNAGIALTIVHCISRRYLALAAPPVVWFGMLSYSVYLWQQPFLNHFNSAWYARMPSSLAIALGCAMISYYCVEKPFLKLRSRTSSFAIVATETQP